MLVLRLPLPQGPLVQAQIRWEILGMIPPLSGLTATDMERLCFVEFLDGAADGRILQGRGILHHGGKDDLRATRQGDRRHGVQIFRVPGSPVTQVNPGSKSQRSFGFYV